MSSWQDLTKINIMLFKYYLNIYMYIAVVSSTASLVSLVPKLHAHNSSMSSGMAIFIHKVLKTTFHIPTENVQNRNAELIFIIFLNNLFIWRSVIEIINFFSTVTNERERENKHNGTLFNLICKNCRLWYSAFIRSFFDLAMLIIFAFL